MNERRSTSLSASQISELIFRHKKKIILCPLLAVALGALVIIYCPRTYRSEAKVFLRVGRESVGLDPTATTGQTLGLQQADRKDEVKSAIDVLTSRDVAAIAVDLVGADVVLGGAGDGAPAQPTNSWIERVEAPLNYVVDAIRSLDPISAHEEAIIRVERNLNVHAERDSTVIEIRYEAKTPKLAQTVCDAVVQAYQLEHMRIYRNQESQPFFSQQSSRLQAELDAALGALRNAKNKMGIASVGERRSTLEAQFSEVQLEKYRAQQQLATAKARVSNIKGQLAKLPERLVSTQRTVPNQGADMLRDQLYALEMKAMDLEARYSDSHPLVQAIHQQLKEAKRVVADQSHQRTETTDAVNPIHRQLSLDLRLEQSTRAGLEARLDELNQQKKTILADLRGLNENEVTIDQLEREAELARGKYLQYAQNLEEARMDQEMEARQISNVSVLQSATLAEKPVSPNKALVIMACFVLATAGTAALVLSSEMFNDKLRGDADVAESLGVPVLGTIPDGRRFQRVFRTPTNGNGNGNGHGHAPQTTERPAAHS